MANFVINQTASEIQQILNKADTPDTTPTTNSQNLVESGGVKTYVDTKVAAGASITTESFAPSALEDSNDGLTSTDTAVPTSRAVSDAIDVVTTKIAQLTAVDDDTYSGNITIPFTISSDPNNIISVLNGVITPTSAGVYQIFWSGQFAEDNNENDDYYNLQLKAGTTILSEITVNETGSSTTYESKNIIAVHNNLNLTTYSAYVRRVEGADGLNYKNQTLTVIKLS